MGFKIQNQDRETSVIFSPADDAFMIEKDQSLTSVIFLDATVNRDLVFEDTRADIDNALSFPAYSAGPVHGEGTFAFWGADVNTDGLVAFAPALGVNDNVGVFDPSTDQYTSGPSTNGSTYLGLVAIPDGRFVLVPNGSNAIGVYDPSDDTFTEGAVPFPQANDGQSGAWGGTVDANGNVVLGAYAARILIYNPSSDTVTDGPNHGERLQVNGKGGAFAEAVTLDNDLVVFAPLNSEYVGIYDPETGPPGTYIRGPVHNEGPEAFSDCVKIPDGRVVFVPRDSTNIGIFDPSAFDFNNPSDPSNQNAYTSGPSVNSNDRFNGGALLDDEWVVFATVSDQNKNIGAYDFSLDRYVAFDEPSLTDFAFIGAASAADGRVILAPSDNDEVGIVSLERTQFLMRNAETGVTEGVNYDNLEQFIDLGDLGVVQTATDVGKFLVPAGATGTTIAVDGLGFRPDTIEFNAQAGVEAFNLDKAGVDNSAVRNYQGSAEGYAKELPDGSFEQFTQHSGGAGANISKVSLYASDSECLGIRFADQAGVLQGRVRLSVSSVNSDGFVIDAVEVDIGSMPAQAVTYRAYKTK